MTYLTVGLMALLLLL